MSETEKIDNAGSSTVEELRAEIQSLQSTLSLALVLTFIFTVAVNIYMLQQARLVNAQAETAQKELSAWVNGGESQARDFLMKLNTYSGTHPDFQPVMQKWSNIIKVSTTPPTTPAPVPAKK